MGLPLNLEMGVFFSACTILPVRATVFLPRYMHKQRPCALAHAPLQQTCTSHVVARIGLVPTSNWINIFSTCCQRFTVLANSLVCKSPVTHNHCRNTCGEIPFAYANATARNRSLRFKCHSVWFRVPRRSSWAIHFHCPGSPSMLSMSFHAFLRVVKFTRFNCN